jgi:hypothetical protein
MTKRKTSRRVFHPGGGEYAGDAGPFSGLNELRARFMMAAFQCEPELEAELTRLYESQLRGRSSWLKSDFGGGLAPPSQEAFDLARTLLKLWGEQFQLRDQWCLDWAWAEKLAVWWAQERKQFGVIQSFWSGPPPVRADPLRVEASAWDVTGSTRSTFEELAREQFERTPGEYCEQLEAAARSAGYVRTKERRNPDHFRWLASYQVCRFSRSAIADAIGFHRQAVQYAIRGLAREIGLTLRPPTASLRAKNAEVLARLNREAAG